MRRFRNSVIDGVAFWDLGQASLQKVQGCPQVITQRLALTDIDLTRCAFVPEPSSVSLLALGWVGLGLLRRRRQRRA